MNSRQCFIAKQQFKARLASLFEYSVVLERMLATEFASVYTRELLSEITQKARGQEDIDVEPSEELVALRDDFPSILRGSLFVYVVNAFEMRARALVNGHVGRDVIPKGASLKTIAELLESNLPSSVDQPTIERLREYKYLRDACTHSGAQVTRELRELLKVSDAVKKIPGVIFRPLLLQYGEDGTIEDLSSFTPKQLAVGRVEFTNEFIPAVIAFFQERFDRITE